MWLIAVSLGCHGGGGRFGARDANDSGGPLTFSDTPAAAANGPGRFGHAVLSWPGGVAVSAPHAEDLDGVVELLTPTLESTGVTLSSDREGQGLGRSMASFGDWIAVSSFGWDAPYQPVLLFDLDGESVWRLDSPSQDSSFGAVLVGAQLDGGGPDLLIADPAGKGAVWVTHGPLDGRTVTNGGRLIGYEEEGALGQALLAADLDGDGADEIIVAQRGRVWVHPDIADGFAASVDVNAELWKEEDGPGYGAQLAAGDFNGDGRPDLVVAGQDQVWVYVFLGSQASSRVEASAQALGSADVDASGDEELVVGAQGELLLYDQPEGVVEAPDVRVEGPQDFGAALSAFDANEDGAEDLLVSSPGAGVVLLLLGR